MTKYGAFISPNPTKMSDLQNDNNYIIIREYELNSASLTGNSSIGIQNIDAGNVITNIGVIIFNPIFTTLSKKTFTVSSILRRVRNEITPFLIHLITQDRMMNTIIAITIL